MNLRATVFIAGRDLIEALVFDNFPERFSAFAFRVVDGLVNVAGITLFFRLDLTANKIYSISAASKRVVATLSEPLTINVFFTRNLPPPHNNTERYLHDLLAEYAIFANKFFKYRFYNVSAEEGEISDQTQENQKVANNYGIHPIQIQMLIQRPPRRSLEILTRVRLDYDAGGGDRLIPIWPLRAPMARPIKYAAVAPALT